MHILLVHGRNDDTLAYHQHASLPIAAGCSAHSVMLPLTGNLEVHDKLFGLGTESYEGRSGTYDLHTLLCRGDTS